MLVLGGVPVLGIVTSLGGVSGVEVVAVSIDALVAVVVMGAMGGFFGLFTGNRVLAVGAALLWAVPAFLVAPAFYALATFFPEGVTHLSPLYGTAARGWAALLPTLAFLPVGWRLARIGQTVFEGRIANTQVPRLFEASVWRQRGWLFEGTILLALGFTVVPVAVGVCWTFGLARASGTSTLFGTWIDAPVQWAARGVLWAFTAGVTSWLTWIYLRLASEWVVALDTLSAPGAAHGRRPSTQPPAVGDHPVLWRERRGYGAWLVAMLMWLLALWVVFQSFVWAIPGGLLFIGVVNAALAWYATVWLATLSVERERRDGTLELLLVSTLRPVQVVAGKAAAVALPTLPLMLIAVPLIVVGTPHLQLLYEPDGPAMLGSVARGLSVALWAIGVWAFLLMMSLGIAVRARRARSAYAISVSITTAFLTVPGLVSVSLPGVEPLRIGARALVPLLGVHAAWWEPLGVTIALMGGSVVVFALVCRNLRAWSAEVRS
jgi:hypothetical protein